MVIEIARITIDPARSAEFESAVLQCTSLFQAAKGCRGMRLEREIEAPEIYRLVVEWDSVEDHTVTFRQSPAFQLWREAAGPFFVGPPEVVHSQITAHGF